MHYVPYISNFFPSHSLTDGHTYYFNPQPKKLKISFLHSYLADATIDGDNDDDDDVDTGDTTGKAITQVLINQGVTVLREDIKLITLMLRSPKL